MPKFLVLANYTAEGTKGVLRDGGSKRRAAAEELVRSAGGRMDAFYFAFGDVDAIVIADLPDTASAAALSLAVNASGMVATRTVVLMTPEEMDQAAKHKTTYRAPGQ